MDPGPMLEEAALAHFGKNLMAVKMYSLASFVMLCYDILITFGDEVEHIWRRKFTSFTILWFLNRYLTPIGFIFILLCFHDPEWTLNPSICSKAVFIPGILGTVTSTVIGCIFIIRLYATYSESKTLLFSMACLLAARETISVWSFVSGQRVQLPPGFVGCILGPGSDGLRFTGIWLAELGFDTIVFLLTLGRAIKLNRISGLGMNSLIKVIVRDGIIYFAIIFIADLVNVLTFLLATPDLQALNASFTITITPLMVSRIILNLRSANSNAFYHLPSSHPTASDGAERYQLTHVKKSSAETSV